MAIIGIGVDIVEIRRIQSAVSQSGNKLAHRILSLKEWSQYQQHYQPVRFLAKRFAIKEAASKALGTGMRKGLAFTQFEVCNDTLGKPLLYLFDQAADMASRLGVCSIHVSLADERFYVYAIVILEN